MRHLCFFWRVFLLLVTWLILANCSGGNCSSVNNTPPVSIGELPTGSTVYITNNTMPVEIGQSTDAVISISGGEPNIPYTISFEPSVVSLTNSVNSQLSLNSKTDYGIIINTEPDPCVVAVGSKSYPSSCKVKITISDNTPAGKYLITPIATNQAGAQQSLSPITVLVNGSSISSSKAIKSFALKSSNGTVSTGIINGQNITVTVPYGTNITNLVAEYVITGVSVSVNGVVQVDAITANDFTSPLKYVVKASDGSTAVSTVTVIVAPSNANNILTYSLNGIPGVITGNNIAVMMPYSTDLSSLIATFATTGVKVSVNNVTQVSGITANSFVSPLEYKVTAADGSVRIYTVTVSTALSNANEITAYSLNGTPGVITGNNIAVMMPYGTDLSSLIATFATTGVKVSVNNVTQVSGVTANSFVSPLEYKVTAADGSTRIYTVTVSTAPSNANEITAYSLNGTPGVITGNNIAVMMPYGTDLSSLIATFTTTGVKVSVDNVTQVSGVTANSFVSPLEYKVTAADGSVRAYTVTVSVAQSNIAEITNYSIQGNQGSIDGESIMVVVPYGTNTALPMIANFDYIGSKITVKGSILPQKSGITPNLFSSPVIYIVTAADGTTKQYTVTVVVGEPDGNIITSYSLRGSTGVLIPGQIDQKKGTISVSMPWHTDPRLMVASFITTGAAKVTVPYTFNHHESQVTVQVPQCSGYSPNNFEHPLVYTVTAPNGETRQYTVTVKVQEYAFMEFSLVDVQSLGYHKGVINQSTGEITVEVPHDAGESFTAYWGIDVSNPKALLANPAFVDTTLQVPLVTKNDYSSPVTFRVIALPFFMKTYKVTVIHKAPPLPDNLFTSYSLKIGNETYLGVIDQTTEPKSIVVSIPSNVDVSKAVATFTTSGTAAVTACAKDKCVIWAPQISGITDNNFSRGNVQYKVTSLDGTNLYNVSIVRTDS